MACAGRTQIVNHPAPPCISTPVPEPPEYEWVDGPSGGLSLNRDDSVDLVLYIQDLETWAHSTYKGCTSPKE